ncbi:MAG: acyl carrier protein [Dysgonamonadaceae bacterium]|jgi:acyl carrier protein|nr:acyl carrier protein [Dysgonamonadaceae bacterium]
MTATFERLQNVFREVFDNGNMVISEDMTAGDVEDWDSLRHMDLISSVEHEFNVKFTMKDILGLKNVGEFLDTLERKLRHG